MVTQSYRCVRASRSACHFDLPVSKATASHHFAVLRPAGLIERAGPPG